MQERQGGGRELVPKDGRKRKREEKRGKDEIGGISIC